MRSPFISNLYSLNADRVIPWLRHDAELSDHIQNRPYIYMEVTRRARSLAGGGSPRWEKYTCQYWMKRSITHGNISRTQREYITCRPGVFLCLKTKAAYEGDTPVYFWIKLFLFLEHLEKKSTHKCSSEELYVITVTCAFTNAVCVKNRDARLWRYGIL